MSTDTRHVDVIVVGGGPSGLAAAIELRQRGVERVVVLDREDALGGVPRHTHHTGYGMRDLRRVLTGPAYARRYIALARRAGVELHAATTVTGWAGPTGVDTTSAGGLTMWQAQAVVLATGCRERPRSARLVPGDRPAGVLTTGSLQQLADLHNLPIGRRAVVVGAEHVSFSAVHTLARHGTGVAAVVTELPQSQTYRPLQLATAGLRRVPVLTSTRLVEIEGRPRVSAVVLSGPDTSARRIECDTVVFTGDWVPDNELARRAELPSNPGNLGPCTDQWLRTVTPGVFAAGNLAHAAETADVAALSGRHAAVAVARYLRDLSWPAQPAIAIRAEAPIRWVFPSHFRAGDGEPPRGRIVLRVAQTVAGCALEVRQGARVLHREAKRLLMPNRSVGMRSDWMRKVDAGGGDLTVSVVR